MQSCSVRMSVCFSGCGTKSTSTEALALPLPRPSFVPPPVPRLANTGNGTDIAARRNGSAPTPSLPIDVGATTSR